MMVASCEGGPSARTASESVAVDGPLLDQHCAAYILGVAAFCQEYGTNSPAEIGSAACVIDPVAGSEVALLPSTGTAVAAVKHVHNVESLTSLTDADRKRASSDCHGIEGLQREHILALERRRSIFHPRTHAFAAGASAAGSSSAGFALFLARVPAAASAAAPAAQRR